MSATLTANLSLNPDASPAALATGGAFSLGPGHLCTFPYRHTMLVGPHYVTVVVRHLTDTNRD
jgi:hypothetical protein